MDEIAKRMYREKRQGSWELQKYEFERRKNHQRQKKKKRIASELDKKITENLEHGKVLMSYKCNPCLIIKGN